MRRSLPKFLPGSTAVVIGVGGLGQPEVQVLWALSATRMVAIDSRAEALELAGRRGAVTVAADDETVAPSAGGHERGSEPTR